MDSHIVLLGLFAVVAYVIVTDDRAAAAFLYVSKLANTEIKRHWWWLTNNPRNPVVKYMIYRRSLRLAKELMVEINKDKEA
jgi:hypothetical protein